MKNLLLIILWLPFMAKSQITKPIINSPIVIVGEWNTLGNMNARIYYRIYNDSINIDTIYTFMYRNASYSHIYSYEAFYFSGSSSFNEFYNILMSFFDDNNSSNKDYQVSFKLGKTDIILSNSNFGGRHCVYMYTSDGITYLPKKPIKKLFNK